MEDTIHRNLSSIRARIRNAAMRVSREPSEITLIAVTKSVGLDEIRVLRDAGITHFGENRVDVAREKIEGMNDTSLIWHMVGNVQRRKAKEVLRVFDTIDAVDRLSLAETFQRHASTANTDCRVLVEVNVSGESQKHGFAPKILANALETMAGFDRVRIDGLMTMAPYGMEREALGALFRELSALAEAHALPEVSMGMSGDFEEAVEAGATQIRVGRALFV